VPQRQWLEHYARNFDTVEVNNSFYRLPEEGIFDSWRARTPAGFLFAVKASRFLTHMKKLKEPAEPVERLLSRAVELQGKLGPVLYQLPKQMPKNVERLGEFLQTLPRQVKHAIEFRDPTWYCEDVLQLLDRHNVAMCLHDMPGSASPLEVTARFSYVRFHGPSGRYSGAYPIEMLETWARWLIDRRIPAFVYFNNDIGGHAPGDAKKLIALLSTGQDLNGSGMNRDLPVTIG
jgi:uncharacterized protein YecE (DUF72 family)